MAYRRADHERWQQMDFVLGIKIELSNQHPVTDICDYSEINNNYKESLKRHDIKIIAQHLTMKKLSKEYGFKYEYTRL